MSEPDIPDGYILVCDSEPRMASWIATVLRAAGYRVEAFSDFGSAWERMQQVAPILAIVGDLFGGMDSWGLLRQIRCDPALEWLGCIAVLASLPDRDWVMAYGRGFDMILVKPFHPTDLLVFVRAVLEFRESGRLQEGWRERFTADVAPSMAEARRRWRMEHDGVVGGDGDHERSEAGKPAR